MTRLLRALTATLAAALIVAPLNLTAAAQTGCPGRVTLGGWTTIGAPTYPVGPGTVADFAADPYMPATIYASNGKSLMVTRDGGCSWTSSLTLNTLPDRIDMLLSGENSEIVDIAIPESRFARTTIYALIAERAGPATRPHVAVSRDGGQSWVLSDEGLPPATGSLLGIHVAPNSPNFVYLHATFPTGGDELFASTDGGRTWQRRTRVPPEGTSIGLRIDPQNSEELWFYGGAGVYHSTDGGRSRALVDSIAPPNPILDVWHGTTALSRIMAWEAETSSISMSRNDGRTWDRISGPIVGNALSIAHGHAVFDVIISLHEGLFRLTGQGWRDITPPSHVDLLDLEMTRTPSPTLLGRTTSTIEVLPNVQGGVTLSPFEVHAATVDAEGVPKISPKKFDVTLRPGEKKTVDLDLDLPPLPNPLDVFFLVDTSKSMDSTIAGLRVGMQDIIDDLADAGLDVQFGVGEFKDYPIPGYGDTQAGDFPYRRNRIIGPPDAELKAALERLESSGGGALDQPESQLTGLYQAATGTGDPPWVAGDQDAQFRDEALKVIVHITDAQFHDEAQHPSPPFNTVAQALKDKGILQVGLAIYGPNGARGLPQLTQMAEATNTLAPEPVDCDGNGNMDIPAGQPLVCEITDEDYDGALNLSPAIVATLKAVTHDVGVQLVPGESPELVTGVSPGLLPDVNLKESNHLGFSVTFRCPESMYGTKTTVPLEAVIGDDVEATSVAMVTCKDEPDAERKEEVLPVIVSALTPPIIVRAAPPPPPPLPIEQIPGTQQMAQAQGAMATEEQEELQVAAAKQRSRYVPAQEDLYEMTAYKESRPSPAPLYVAAMLMGVASAAAHRMRTRTRTAFQTRRR